MQRQLQTPRGHFDGRQLRLTFRIAIRSKSSMAMINRNNNGLAGCPIRTSCPASKLDLVFPNGYGHVESIQNIYKRSGTRCRRNATFCPLWLARATGQDIIHATRFKNRKEPPSQGPLGKAPSWMKKKEQLDAWKTFRDEIPWLNKSHRFPRRNRLYSAG